MALCHAARLCKSKRSCAFSACAQSVAWRGATTHAARARLRERVQTGRLRQGAESAVRWGCLVHGSWWTCRVQRKCKGTARARRSQKAVLSEANGLAAARATVCGRWARRRGGGLTCSAPLERQSGSAMRLTGTGGAEPEPGCREWRSVKSAVGTASPLTAWRYGQETFSYRF